MKLLAKHQHWQLMPIYLSELVCLFSWKFCPFEHECKLHRSTYWWGILNLIVLFIYYLKSLLSMLYHGVHILHKLHKFVKYQKLVHQSSKKTKYISQWRVFVFLFYTIIFSVTVLIYNQEIKCTCVCFVSWLPGTDLVQPRN